MRAIGRASILSILVGTGFASAAIHRVSPDGTGDYPTIQAAIQAAAPRDTIDLEDGTFIGEGNRDLSFEGKALLIRSRSGSAAACIIDCGGCDAEPHRALSTQTEGPGSILEGVTLTGGCLTQPEVLGGGGAILCEGTSSPLIRYCVFRGNAAFHGGAVHCADAAAPRIRYCSFAENLAGGYPGGGAGGAFSCDGQAAPILDHCEFTANTAQRGGAVATAESSEPTFLYCTIVANHAYLEGAAIDCHGRSMTVEHATIADNALETAGSAVAVATLDPVAVRNTIIAFSVNAGALACSSGGAVLYCCDVYGNPGGDWVGCIAGQETGQGNFCLDPMFCRDQNPGEPYTLMNNSRCYEMENPQCGRVGALGLGCMLPQSAEPALADGAWGLGAAQPNPFRQATALACRLPADSDAAGVTAGIFDAAGHAVRRLVPEMGMLRWDGRDASGQPLPAGIYFCRLTAGSAVSTRAILRLR